MPRQTEEWMGKNDDAPIPDKVKRRVKVRAGECCQACGIRVRYGGQVDHIEPVINSTPDRPLNREGNLQWLCAACHGKKTGEDVRNKARDHRKEIKLAGLKTPSRRKPFYPPKPEKPKGEWVFWQDENGRGRSTWVPPRSTEDVGGG